MKSARKLKPRTCKAADCSEQFDPWSSLQVVCSPKCAQIVAAEKVAKKQRSEALKTKRERIAMKKAFRDKDKRFHMKKAVMFYNRWIVKVRDAGEPCISSGRTEAVQWQCGHYIPGTCAALRFDEDNTHKQSSEDNLYRSGNLTEYRINLIKKIGQDRVDRLEGPQPDKKYTVDELKAIAADYQQRLKDAGC